MSAPVRQGGKPTIDEGMRSWYGACRCCMNDAYPEVVAALDAERTAARQPVSGPGICEVAEGKAPEPPSG